MIFQTIMIFNVITGSYLEVLHYLLTLNSVTNPMVYIIFNEDLVKLVRSWIVRILGKDKR